MLPLGLTRLRQVGCPAPDTSPKQGSAKEHECLFSCRLCMRHALSPDTFNANDCHQVMCLRLRRQTFAL